MESITGKAMFKKDSKMIYADEDKTVFNVTKLNYDDWLVSLKDTPFENKFRDKATIGLTAELDFIELYKTVKEPFTLEEATRLIDFAKTFSSLYAFETVDIIAKFIENKTTSIL